MGHPTKAADDYLQNFRAQVSTANRVIILLSLTLLVVWFNGLENTYSQIRGKVAVELVLPRILDAQKNKFEAFISKKIRNQNEQMEKFDNQIDNQIDVESANLKRTIISKNIQNQERQLKTFEKQIDEERANLKKEETKKVNFNLLGFTIPLPILFATLFWLGLFVWLLAYINFKRINLMRLLAKAMKSFEDEKKCNLNQISDIAGIAPFWLAPVRKVTIPIEIKPDLLKKAMGWDNQKELINLGWLLLIGTLFFIIQMRVAYINLMVSDTFPQNINLFQESDTIRKVVQIFSFSFIGISFFFLISWLLPEKTFFWLNFKKKSNYQIKFEERRNFIKLLGFGAITGALVAPLVKPFATWDKFTRTSFQETFEKFTSSFFPRYTKREKNFVLVNNLAQGFYENTFTKKKTVHYVFPDKKIRGIQEISISGLKPVKLDTETIQRLHKPKASFACEIEALTALLNGLDISKATKILWVAIRFDLAKSLSPSGKPSYRLYDLLAGLLIRFDKQQEFGELISVIENSRRHSSFRLRIQKWRDPESKWHLLWVNLGNPIYWKWNLGAKFNALKL